MRTRLVISIGLATLMILGLYTVLAGSAMSSSDYTIATSDGLVLSLSAGGQVTSLKIDGQELAGAPAPALTLRDLSDAGSVIAPNLIANPGFEAGLDHWSEALNQGLDIGVVVSPTHSGDHALVFTNTVTTTRVAGYASRSIAVTPGQRYRLSAWFLSSTGYVTYPMGTPPLMQMKIYRTFQAGNGLYVVWLDGNGMALGQPQLVTPLHTEASRWRLIRGEVTAPPGASQARALIGVRISDQILWVDDVVFVASPETDALLSGIVAPCLGQDDCLQQTVTSSGLAITVTYTAHDDYIAVHGDVVDTTGQDRALDVGWGVPLATGDSVWWDDAHTTRPITDTGLYVNQISAIYDGWLPMSLYPYAGVQMDDAGLALGLPLNRPHLAMLALDGATGRYGVTFHLGISPQAIQVGPRATFDLMLYRFDPAWGFRDVIARHQALQADFYTTPRVAALYDYQGRSQGQYYTTRGAHIVKQEDISNTYSAQYTSSDMVLRVARSDRPRPTMDDIMHVLSLTLNSPYTESVALGEAITQSAAVEPNGEWSLKQVGIFPWDTEHWEAAWAGNVDPDIQEGLASFLMDYRISRAFQATEAITAHLDGVQIDNFMSNPTFDLRPEALAASDWSLSYTPHTYQPAVHTGFAQAEFLAYLRLYLDENWGRERDITINFWALGHGNYLVPYIDGFGSEGQLHPNGEGENFKPQILDYRRALTAQRPYLFTIQASGVTASQAYTVGQLALLYGVYPGHGPNGQGWDPAADQIISDTAKLVRHYWAAGWEPLTYAQAEEENVWIERFGDAPSPSQQVGDRGLYFTIHNRSDITRTGIITIESAPLGLTDPAAAVLTDIAITQTIPFVVANGDIRFSLMLGPRQTRIVQVSGGVQQPTPTPTPSPTATALATSTPTPTPTATALATSTPTPTPPPPTSHLYLPLIVSAGGGIDVSQLVETDDDILGISDLFPGPYAEVMAAGARVVNLEPMHTFFVLWAPEGYENMDARRVMVIAHGHTGSAYRETGLELAFAQEHGYAIVAIQWWPGEGDAMYSAQQFYEIMDVALRYMEYKYHAQLDKCALRGWSLGSEISYEVTYLDKISGNPRLALTISHDGGMMPDTDNMSVGREFTQNLYDGVYGADAFADTHFYLYSGAEPQIGYMRNTAEVISNFGGVVERLVLDEGAGHDGFYRHPQYHEDALSIFFGLTP